MPTTQLPPVTVPPPLPPIEERSDSYGGEGWRCHWSAWIVALILFVLVLYGVIRVGRYALARPLPLMSALTFALTAVWRVRSRLLEEDIDPVYYRVVGAAIAGGVLGELAHYVVIGVPPSVPHNPLWWLIGAGGIGGAIGVGAGLSTMMLTMLGALVGVTWRHRDLT